MGACVHEDSSIAVATSSDVMRDAFTARNSGRRNKVVITLMFPFKLEEVVVTTGRAIRVIPADRWTPFINGAAAFGLIKKHAHGFVHGVVAVTQHAHCLAFVLDLLGEFFTRNIHCNAMMLGQTRHVSRFGFDVIVAAAVAGALGAVVGVFGRHDADLNLFGTDSKGLPRSRHHDLLEYGARPDGMLWAR